MIKQKVGFVLYDNVNALDLVGPLEAFHTVSEVAGPAYEMRFVSHQKGQVKTESGLPLVADKSIDDIGPVDILIVPGGSGSRDKQVLSWLCPWLQSVQPEIKRIVSVCTGAYVLASAGLLDGYRATTHWAHIDDFAQRFPKVILLADELYVDNGHIATSAGITSGIDLTLKLVEDDLGADIAAKVARYLVVHYRRSGHQAQFSLPLKYQIKADSQFASLHGWVMTNLQQDLSVSQLAEQAQMSERNFCRRFKEQMGQSPGRYVESLRLDYARQLLVEKPWPISRVSEACGYQHDDVFRRAFERRFLVAPKAYRAMFAPKATNNSNR